MPQILRSSTFCGAHHSCIILIRKKGVLRKLKFCLQSILTITKHANSKKNAASSLPENHRSFTASSSSSCSSMEEIQHGHSCPHCQRRTVCPQSLQLHLNAGRLPLELQLTHLTHVFLQSFHTNKLCKVYNVCLKKHTHQQVPTRTSILINKTTIYWMVPPPKCKKLPVLCGHSLHSVRWDGYQRCR